MSADNHYSDEHLNAFVDNQLDGAERSRIIEALNLDPELGRRIGEIRKLKELVRYAYDIPVSTRGTARRAYPWRRPAAVAASLLVTTAVGAWLWHARAPNASIAGSVARTHGVVVQVSENDPIKWDLALINVRSVRKAFPAGNVAIEIVAYGPGLQMFRKDSPLGQRLDEAAKAGVKLLACGNTMTFTRTTADQLNPSVEVVKAGVVEIMQKQEQGYSYIRP